MGTKKCRACEFFTEDESQEICPECGEELIPETDSNNLADVDEESDAVLSETEGDEITDESKADKKIKIITAAVAFVLVMVVGFFTWFLFAGRNNDDNGKININKVAGEYLSHDKVEYFKFETKEVEVELPSSTGFMDAMFGDAEVLSDSVIGSDALLSGGEKEYATFDGTYESGPTERSIHDVVIINYINSNGLSEEYSKYVEDNNLYVDDFEGFVKEKGIPQEKLDILKDELGLSEQLEYYVRKGYWRLNKENNSLELYDETGLNMLSSFAVAGNSIVENSSFWAGKSYDSAKFETVYKYGAEGYMGDLFFYKDGNCILKTTYQGEEEYIAGTYTGNKEFIKVKLQGQTQTFVKVKGGIAKVAYIKQK